MGTSEVFKVFKIARAAGEWNLKTLKASRVTKMHARAIIRTFVYHILNKIIKESVFGTYFNVKYL